MSDFDNVLDKEIWFVVDVLKMVVLIIEKSIKCLGVELFGWLLLYV